MNSSWPLCLMSGNRVGGSADSSGLRCRAMFVSVRPAVVEAGTIYPPLSARLFCPLGVTIAIGRDQFKNLCSPDNSFSAGTDNEMGDAAWRREPWNPSGAAELCQRPSCPRRPT
jgi:hypothetical protein